MLSHEALSATEARLGWEGTSWQSLGAGIWEALLGTGKAPAFCSSHLQEGKGSLWAGVRPAGVLPTDGDRQDLGAHGEAVSPPPDQPYSHVLGSPSHSQWQLLWPVAKSAQIPWHHLGGAP